MRQRIVNKINGNPLNLRLTTILFSLTLLLHGASGNVYADNLGDRLRDLKDANDESDFLTSIVEASIILAGMALIGLGIYAGYIMLTSSGNPEKINEAREIITNAVLGFALIALSVGILMIIADILQLPGL